MKFKLRQMVEICQDIPDWPKATSFCPPVGARGMVVTGNQYKNKYHPPDGQVAVRFKAVDLGYEPWGDKSHRFIVHYIREWALKAFRK